MGPRHDSSYISFGIGGSCGQWVADRAPSSGGALRTKLRLQWVYGYLTAVGSYSPFLPKNVRYPRDADEDAITVSIDNYCRAHPLELFVNAAGNLNYELTH